MRFCKKLSIVIAVLLALAACTAAGAEVFVSDEDTVYTNETAQEVAQEAIQPDAAEPAAASLSLNVGGAVALVEGDTFELTAVSLSADQAAGLIWESTDADVATVEPSQRDERSATLTAVKAGSAIINCRTPDGLSTSLSVTVAEAAKPDSIMLNLDETETMNLGDTFQLIATLTPNTARANLKWTTSKKAVVSVDETGLITALKEGTATITVRTEGKKNVKKARVKIKVVDPYKPTEVAFAAETATVNIGDSIVLNPILTPAEARTTYKWTSKSSKIASVSENGVVTGMRVGTTTITVRTANKKTARCKIQVVDNKQPTAVRFDTEDVVLLKGSKAQLKALLTPESARTLYRWKSSKPKVVKVTQDGQISCLKAGTATITVTTYNKLTAEMNIQVVDDTAEANTTVNGWIWPVHATLLVDNAVLVDDVYVATGDSILFRWEIDGSASGYSVYVDHGEGDTAETVMKLENTLENEVKIKRSDVVVGDYYRLDLGVMPLAGDTIDMSWTTVRFLFSDNGASDEAPAQTIPQATEAPAADATSWGAATGGANAADSAAQPAETAGDEEGLVFDDELIW